MFSEDCEKVASLNSDVQGFCKLNASHSCSDNLTQAWKVIWLSK